MKILNSTAYLFVAILVLLGCSEKKETIKPPNIVYILADDMGYGDLSIYNPESRIKTPNIDRLASEGMRFTDAHSPSAVCTPTRYGILTGRYCWRSRLPTGVLRGYGHALLEKDRTTAASLLKEHGYTTGVIGKWHLGLDWVLKEEYKDSINSASVQISELGLITEMNGDWIDFTKKPTDGPLNHGFDYSYILPASLDMDPYCYLENDVLTALPNDHSPGNDLDTGSYATEAFWRPGRMAKDFDFYEVLPRFIDKAKEFVKSQSHNGKPFFLYLPLAAPHTPWLPNEDFMGTSGAGQYGDFVQMVDDQVGSFLKSLDESKVSENTIVIFASDNGPFWKPDFVERFNHKAAYIYRGMKADIYDGGHRIPLIVRWPGKIKAGSVSNFRTTLTNLIATCADLINTPLNDTTGEDSQSIFPVLMGNDEFKTEAMPIVHHSSQGFFALRKGDWKLIEKRGSGGFSQPVVVESKPGEPLGALYNMDEDPSETNNLYNEKPRLVRELLAELDSIRNR